MDFQAAAQTAPPTVEKADTSLRLTLQVRTPERQRWLNRLRGVSGFTVGASLAAFGSALTLGDLRIALVAWGLTGFLIVLGLVCAGISLALRAPSTLQLELTPDSLDGRPLSEVNVLLEDGTPPRFGLAGGGVPLQWWFPDDKADLEGVEWLIRTLNRPVASPESASPAPD